MPKINKTKANKRGIDVGLGYYFVDDDDDVEHKEAEQAMHYKATQQPWITNRRGGSQEWG